jgi:hypothetical protein
LSTRDTPSTDVGSGPMIDHLPDEEELRAEAHRLVYVAARVRPVQTCVTWVEGHAVVTRDRGEPALPVVGSQQWWDAPERLRIAALLRLAEAYLLADPERMVTERLKAAAVAISQGRHWAFDTSHATVAARRGELGPMYRPFDPNAARQWATTRNGNGRDT